MLHFKAMSNTFTYIVTIKYQLLPFVCTVLEQIKATLLKYTVCILLEISSSVKKEDECKFFLMEQVTE